MGVRLASYLIACHHVGLYNGAQLHQQAEILIYSPKTSPNYRNMDYNLFTVAKVWGNN